MIKAILFDCDGPIIRHAPIFSRRLKEQKGIIADTGKEDSFFKNEFLLCEIGRADLKIELAKRLDIWEWPGSVEELLDFWFAGEAEVDREMADYIALLRGTGIKTFLSTNNEKYRVDYLWNQVGLKNILDGKLPSCEVGHLKSDPAFWAEALNRLPQVSKEEILVLDDSQKALDAASGAGFKTEFYTDFTSFKNVMAEKYKTKI